VFEVVRAEVMAVHERVGLLDLTGFAKYEISGPGAEAFLNRICANRMPRKPGGIALVHLLSPRGRIRGEMTVTRLADDRFYALSAAAAELRDLDHLEQSILPGDDVRVADITEERGVIVVSGPRSRALLSALTDADLGNQAFPWLRGREIVVAGQPVRALRVSYVGELGWELHPPMGSMPALYDALRDAGSKLGVVSYGLYAVNSMRVEKGYKAWSTELTNEINMLEADMSRFIDFTKDKFIGKEATQNQAPRPFKIVYAQVEAREADARGGEPVMVHDRCVGLVTSGAYGHRTDRSLCFASVEPRFAMPGTRLDVLIQGELRGAHVLGSPAFDAGNSRMRD
jgi:dimethylglycine dehydrogenase